MKILDLFCGTKSIANAFEEEGFESLTLDNNLKFSPNIWTDILQWNYMKSDFLESGVDVIWASPPCEGFSVAAISKNWRIVNDLYKPISKRAEFGMDLVKKTIEIIDYFRPRYWFIENPRAMLRKMDFMRGLPRQTITYCQYGDTRMKPTDIWGFFPDDFPIKNCKAGDKCHEAAPRGSRTGTQGLKGSIERGRVPKEFCSLLAKEIKREICVGV